MNEPAGRANDRPTIEGLDLLAATWEQGVPYGQFDRLRREAPVAWHEEDDGPGFWVISKHADVKAISHDSVTFSSELGGTFIDTQTDAQLAAMRLSILNMDPPKHHRYRRLVNRGFTPRAIQALLDSIDRRAARIVGDVVDRGECEFVEEIAALLPLEMICEMIGLPEQDWPRMFELSNCMVGFDDPEYQASPDDGMAAAFEIFTYCDAVAADRRANPRDDIMTALVHAEVDGETLTPDELNLFFVTLVVAGNETTRNLINHALCAVIDHPDEARRLRDDPSLWETAPDEMLRWGTSIHNFRRTATVDTEVRGVPIAEGDKVVMYYLSANRDDEAFPHPYRFDPGRSPNDHVTFGGGGVHYCLGASLARAEIGALMRQVVERLPDIELAAEPRRLRSDFINGIKHMPVSWKN
jgi:cholest-4-en-3-one 26-monooxygenase